MKNQAHVKASFYLIFDTDMDEEEFQSSFNEDAVVGSDVKITLPNGRTYKASFADLLKTKLEYFDVIEEDEETEEKSPSSELDDQIAI
jgi:hypothetical protein